MRVDLIMGPDGTPSNLESRRLATGQVLRFSVVYAPVLCWYALKMQLSMKPRSLLRRILESYLRTYVHVPYLLLGRVKLVARPFLNL